MLKACNRNGLMWFWIKLHWSISGCLDSLALCMLVLWFHLELDFGTVLSLLCDHWFALFFCSVLQKFVFGGRLIFGPDARSVPLTVLLILVPVVLFCVFVARHLLHEFSPHNAGYAILVVPILFTVYVSLLWCSSDSHISFDVLFFTFNSCLLAVHLALSSAFNQHFSTIL